jgi:hypothetical protein
MCLLIAAMHFLATGLLWGQEPAVSGVPIPGEKAFPGRAIRVPLGVKESKPVIPSIEKLIEKSRDAKVEADRVWIVIEHPKSGGMSVIDLDKDGSCYLMEREQFRQGGSPSCIVRSGKTIPRALRENMIDLACRKSVLFGVGGVRLLSKVESTRMRLGVAANYGRSVYTSRPATFDQYPQAFREAVISLLAAARKLPLSEQARGIVSAQFVDPRQARRLTVLGGQALVAVRDPGKDATVLSPVVAAARMPGRMVVVEKEEDWQRVLSYLSGGTGQVRDDHCLISVGAHCYRLLVEPLGE